MKAPISAIKHYVSFTNAQISVGTVAQLECVQGVAQTAVTNTADVVEGSVIKAVYIELWILGQGATGIDTQITMAIYKNPAGLTKMTASDLANAMGYANKKNIFYFTQAVFGDKFTNSVPLFKGWIRLPKGKQRFGLGDQLICSVVSTEQAIQRCGFSTYKEYK